MPPLSQVCSTLLNLPWSTASVITVKWKSLDATTPQPQSSRPHKLKELGCQVGSMWMNLGLTDTRRMPYLQEYKIPTIKFDDREGVVCGSFSEFGLESLPSNKG